MVLRNTWVPPCSPSPEYPTGLVQSLPLLGLLVVLATGGPLGCARPVSVPEARALMARGELRRACAGLEAGLTEPAPRDQRMERLRLYVECEARAGELPRAERGVRALPAGPLRQYGEAVLAVAAGPSGLTAGVAAMRRVAADWPDEPEPPHRAGLWLLADDQAAAAVPLLERACALSARAACAVALAHALLDLDRLDEALGWLRKVPDLVPRAADVQRGRAMVQRVMRRGRSVPESAQSRYREALRALEQEDKAAEALTALEELLVAHPRAAALHTAAGLAHLRLGSPAEAVVALEEAARLSPYDPTNPFYLAVLYQARGSERAMSLYRRTLELDPFHKEAASALAGLLLRTGQPREAATLLERLATMDGGEPTTRRLAARAWLAAGDDARAETHFTRLLQKDAANFELNLRMAQILLRRHQRQKAPALLTRAREHAEAAAKARADDPELRSLQATLAAAD